MLQYQKIKKKLEYFKKYFMQNVSYILKKNNIFDFPIILFHFNIYQHIKKNNIFLDIILSRYALHNLLFLHYSLVLLIKV